MARFCAAFASTGAGSATLPIGALYATTTCRPRLVEVHVTNTSTSTGLTVILTRLTTAGTSTAITNESYEDDNSQANVAGCVRDHSGTAPTLGNPLRRATLPANGGIIWTAGWGKTPGWVIPNTTGDGIGVIPAATGQICDMVFVWDE